MKQFVTILSLVILLASCGNNGLRTHSNDIPEPRTYETAFQKAYGPRVSDTPDTLALGYYWGMTKSQTSEHEKSLALRKKIFYKKNKGYIYEMPLTHYDEAANKTDYYMFRVSTEHYKDTLKAVTLWLNAFDNNYYSNGAKKDHDLTIEDLYKEFGPIFEAKGYLCQEVVDPKRTMADDPYYGLPKARWPGTEYRFVKDNTLIRLWHGQEWSSEDLLVTYYDMSEVYKEQQDIAAKKAVEEKKAAEENAAREEHKKEYLRDF